MKNLRMIMMTSAVAIALVGAVATSYAKMYFVVAYVAPAPTSCQMTSKPEICNTTSSAICTLGTTFYQHINTQARFFCYDPYRMPQP